MIAKVRGSLALSKQAAQKFDVEIFNLNNVRLEAIRHFRNKKKAYLEAKIEELETNSKIKNIRDLYRGINDFNKVYQTRTNIVKDEKGYLFTDSHSILVK